MSIGVNGSDRRWPERSEAKSSGAESSLEEFSSRRTILLYDNYTATLHTYTAMRVCF